MHRGGFTVELLPSTNACLEMFDFTMLSSRESHNMFSEHLSVELVNQPRILLHFVSATMLISDKSLRQLNAPKASPCFYSRKCNHLFPPTHTKGRCSTSLFNISEQELMKCVILPWKISTLVNRGIREASWYFTTYSGNR